MRSCLGAFSALTLLFLSACGGNAPPPPALPTPPAIKAFQADKVRIRAGESVTLSWNVENATEVSLIDDQGETIDVKADAFSGSVTVSPTVTTFYLLKAVGDGGRDNAFVQVAVGEDLKEVVLLAVPPVIDAGGTAQLLWSADGAREAKLQSTTGMVLPLQGENGSGVVEVTPARTQGYTLVASGANSEKPLTTTVEVKVRPVIESAVLEPAVAKAGENVTFTWKTRGASQVSIREATWGEVYRSSKAEDADAGTFSWTVPEQLPTGIEVTDGMPLRFTLEVKQVNPEVTLTKKFDGYVGEGPVVVNFVAPKAISAGEPVTFQWRTVNATAVKLLANGLRIYESLPGDLEKAENGSYTYPVLNENTRFELVAISHLGATARQQLDVEAVPLPVINSFNVPASVNGVGLPVTASWATQNAYMITLRVQDGPVVYSSVDGMTLASGQTDLYPGANTTFVLEAWNRAGARDVREATVQLAGAPVVSASPSPTTPGTVIDLEWDLSSTPIADVHGIPSATPLSDPNATNWYDLDNHVDAQELAFSEDDDAVAEIPLAVPFRFPLFNGVIERFYVSTNGFVAFEKTGALPTNGDFNQPGHPMMIAPFWDDLTLGEGDVRYMVEGTSFPRRLIIQWNKVRTNVDEASELTFQVQLLETGAFRVIHGALSGTDSKGENATVGVNLGHSTFRAQQFFDAGTPVLTEWNQYDWFNGGPLSGAQTITAVSSARYGFFGELQTGGFTVFSAPVWVFGPGSLQVTEAMPAPGPTATAGQWVEIYNAQPLTVDITGLELQVTSGQTQPLPSVMMPPYSYLLIGESTDPNDTGGAAVEFTWNNFALSTTDTVNVVLGLETVSSLEWATAVPGESAQAKEDAIDGAGKPLGCTRTMTFGNGDIGTPGAPNETCFDYVVTSIPGAWEDISADGTSLMGTSTNNVYYQHSLAAPFPYFGQPYSDISISSHGFITIGYTLTSAYGTNATTPSPVPQGVVAPFWDYLYRHNTIGAGGDGALRVARRSSYTVVSWDNFRVSGGGENNRQYFQVKLFDSGVIEYHYGRMDPSTGSGTAADYHTGNGATVWLERPDGTAALPIGINKAGTIQANTGLRFTPVP